MSFSLYYAPPEVVVAYKEKRRTILADPSADVWALGVRLLRLPCLVPFRMHHKPSERSGCSRAAGRALLGPFNPCTSKVKPPSGSTCGGVVVFACARHTLSLSQHVIRIHVRTCACMPA